MNTGKFLWAFGAILLLMLIIVMIKPGWVRGTDDNIVPAPFSATSQLDTDLSKMPCLYFWQVDGLAHLTRLMDSTTAGPYQVTPTLVDVDFYPVSQLVYTEGLATKEHILSRVQIPRPYILGQWDPVQVPEVTFVRRECPKLPTKPDPATAIPDR